MDKKYLIDTNIIIYFLDGKIPDNHLRRVLSIFENSFNISTISKIEILGWNKITNKEIVKIKSFLKSAKVFYIDEKIETKAIEIKQKHKIAIPDALIGATAILNNFTLVTRNETDFRKIGTIEIYNPFKGIDKIK